MDSIENDIKRYAANLTHEQLCMLVANLAIRVAAMEWAALGVKTDIGHAHLETLSLVKRVGGFQR